MLSKLIFGFLMSQKVKNYNCLFFHGTADFPLIFQYYLATVDARTKEQI